MTNHRRQLPPPLLLSFSLSCLCLVVSFSTFASLTLSCSPPSRDPKTPTLNLVHHSPCTPSGATLRRMKYDCFLEMIGLALITKNEAWLWTDGRYFLPETHQLND
ncbi:hypothetical protein ACE6H2_020754 [Prunus campanulata]